MIPKERGEGRIGLVIALIVVAVAVYVGVKVIPLKVALYTFSDRVEQKMQRASWRSDEVARKETLEFVRREAEATGYPIDKLKVSMPARTGSELVLTIDWQIPMDFSVTQYTWNYHLVKRVPTLGRGGSSW